MKIALHKSPTYVAKDENEFGRFEIRINHFEFAHLGHPTRVLMDRDDRGLFIRSADSSAADKRRSAAVGLFKVKGTSGTRRQSSGRRIQLAARHTPLAGVNRFNLHTVTTTQDSDDLFGGPKLRFRLIDQIHDNSPDNSKDRPAKTPKPKAEVAAPTAEPVATDPDFAEVDEDPAEIREALRCALIRVNAFAERASAKLYIDHDGKVRADIRISTVLTL